MAQLKLPLLRPLARISLPLAKRLRSTGLLPINAGCLWNAITTANAPLTVSVPRSAPSTVLSTAQDATVLPAPAMDVQTGPAAGLTNTSTLRKMPTGITVLPLLTQGKASTLLPGKQRLWLRTRVFYCDPMQSGQKGSLENKHVQLRYILPKGTDLRALGVTGQSALNLALSHVNSAPVEMLGGRSPLELTDFMYHDLYEKLEAFGIHKIEKDKVILKPYLLKK